MLFLFSPTFCVTLFRNWKSRRRRRSSNRRKRSKEKRSEINFRSRFWGSISEASKPYVRTIVFIYPTKMDKARDVRRGATRFKHSRHKLHSGEFTLQSSSLFLCNPLFFSSLNFLSLPRKNTKTHYSTCPFLYIPSFLRFTDKRLLQIMRVSYYHHPFFLGFVFALYLYICIFCDCDLRAWKVLVRTLCCPKNRGERSSGNWALSLGDRARASKTAKWVLIEKKKMSCAVLLVLLARDLSFPKRFVCFRNHLFWSLE